MISEWYHKPATNDRQQQSQQQRNVSAAGNSNTMSAGDAMTSTASVVPATVSVTAQLAPVTTGARTNMMTSATTSDDMDTTVLYHDDATTSIIDL